MSSDIPELRLPRIAFVGRSNVGKSSLLNGLLGARELGLMKSSAYLINTSRGPIVDEEALAAALQNKKIAGAGLDVFGDEPLPLDHPLRHLENTVITPHIGYVTEDTYKIFFDQTVENIKAFLDGTAIRVINRHQREQKA